MFVFQFHHWRDKKRVVEGQPWHFDKHAIILGDIEGNTRPSDMQLFALPMWVRVYNLPFKGRLNTKNVEAIGKKIGSFVKIDNSGSIGIDKSIHLRILVDVRRPLLKAVKVKMRGGEEGLFEVKYEKPPLLCYFCGKVGHGLKDCMECREEDDPQQNFRTRMKASPWKRNMIDEENIKRVQSENYARSLFITKPTRRDELRTKHTVTELVNKLQGWGLEETEGQEVRVLLKGVRRIEM